MNPAAQYHITHNFKREKYDVSTTNKTHLYHIDSSIFTIGKPDLTFHHGPDSNGPVVGVCKFRHFSSDCEVGLRQPERPNEMNWVYLHKEGFLFMKRVYWFRMELDDGTKQTFTWKQTRSLGSGSENHKLVEETSQTVVAVLSSGGIFSKKPGYGYLDIYSNLGPRFYLTALISGIAVVERIRRATRSGAGAGAGGSSAAAGGGGGIC